LLATACVGSGRQQAGSYKTQHRYTLEAPMNLGNFSVSLAVKDLAASRAFYEALGFTSTMGAATHGWLIMRNGDTVIGLFQGMFDRNMLTFNPGWDREGNTVPGFTDVRELQRQLKAKGIVLKVEADESTSGPAHLIAIDPDGNPVMLDQHV
jgi:catechol 2,3-dioxygenase-like lactoylglutathione lyase family enzyme